MIKKVLLFQCFLLLSSALWAEYRPYGIGIEGYFYRVKDVDINGDVVKDDTITIAPSVSIMMNDIMEIAPFLTVGIDSETDDGVVLERYFSIGAGVGFNFHLFQREYFRFAAGTSVAMDYSWAILDPVFDMDRTIGFRIQFPLIAEFVPTDRMSFRISMNLLRLQGDYRTYDYGSGELKRNTTTFGVITPFTEINIGLYYRFDTKKTRNPDQSVEETPEILD